MKAIVCVGVSASGKSYWARDWCMQPDWVELNRDNVRFNHGPKDWTKYKFTRANENKVSEKIDYGLELAANLELNVVISDTNLTKKYRDILVDKLEKLGYEVEIKVFHISLEDAWKRDANRQGGVGHSMIYSQYEKYLDYIGRRTYSPDSELPRAIICDIDGTVADMKNVRGPFDWSLVGEDNPRNLIIDTVDNYYLEQGYEVIFLSGRDSVCREDTLDWLVTHTSVSSPILYMRAEGDSRKDTIIKEELFWEHIADRWNVVGAVDDRPCMVRMWNELKIPNVINVGNSWKEF